MTDAEPAGTKYTIQELADRINKLGVVTDEAERAGNLTFITNLHGMMKEGGTWGWPDAMEVYEKDGDGWKRLM